MRPNGLTACIPVLALLITTAAVSGCATSTQPRPEADGLVLQPSRNFDEVYLRPGANFKSYGNIVLQPVQVAFDKDWDPNDTQRDLARRLSAEDIQKLRDEMAAEFRRIFVEELTASGYRIVEQVGSDSLVTAPALTDVYINAPDKMAPGRSRTYTMESGRMTLNMELRDGVTGQLIGRVVDRKIGDNFGRLELTDSVTNSADFRRAVRNWAVQLRKGLDVLRSNAFRPVGVSGCVAESPEQSPDC
jgi:hypothetical protein